MYDGNYRKCLKYIQKADGENVAFQKIREFLHRNHNLPTDMLIKKLNKMIQANHHYNNLDRYASLKQSELKRDTTLMYKQEG